MKYKCKHRVSAAVHQRELQACLIASLPCTTEMYERTGEPAGSWYPCTSLQHCWGPCFNFTSYSLGLFSHLKWNTTSGVARSKPEVPHYQPPFSILLSEKLYFWFYETLQHAAWLMQAPVNLHKYMCLESNTYTAALLELGTTYQQGSFLPLC